MHSYIPIYEWINKCLLTYSFNDLHSINFGSSQWHERVKYIEEHLREEENEL